jgi:hypothetical protein
MTMEVKLKRCDRCVYCGRSASELAALREENERLRQENEKQAYTVSQVCGAHIGVKMKRCAACERDELLKELHEMRNAQSMDDLVSSNIETTKRFLEQGLSRARIQLKAGNPEMALKCIEAAQCFHPMYAESWPGWPDEPKHDPPAAQAGEANQSGKEEHNG